ncbi:MAG: choice-of-anchor Q domain-containing protein [Chloroflexota bacterium]
MQEIYRQLKNLSRRTGHSIKRKWSMTLASAALAVALIGSPTLNVAHAAEITVDGNSCSLVDAITAANTNTAVGGCDAGDPGADTIVLKRNIVLRDVDNTTHGASGTPVISSEIVIEGNGYEVERHQSADPFRIFTIAGANGNLTLFNINVTGGEAEFGGGVLATDNSKMFFFASTFSKNEATHSGGGIAIMNGVKAKISQSTVENNRAGYAGGGVAIMHDNAVNIFNSVVTKNEADHTGGGISIGHDFVVDPNSDGSTLTAKYNSVTNNSAKHGGGIVNASAPNGLHSQHTTISDNEATEGAGGGLLNFGHSEMLQMTIANNKAEGNGGGIANENGTLANGSGVAQMLAGTIAGNESKSYGGGISNEGDFDLTGMIVSGNRAAEGAEEIFNLGDTDGLTSIFSHDKLDSDEAFFNYTPEADSLNASGDADDIRLSDIFETRGNRPRLQDNGGVRHTIALVVDSPAIGFSLIGGFLDGRGFVRDADPDAGAFEYGSYPLEASCEFAGPFADEHRLSITDPVTYIMGTAGNDNIKGTSGNDIILGLGGKDRIDGREGNDCIIGGEGNDTLTGGTGDDLMWGNDDDDRLDGGDGDDEMHGGSGKDRMEGHAGNDRMFGDDGDDTLVGRSGNDYMSGGNDGDRLEGGDGDDELWGDDHNDRMNGGAGNDLIHGGAGDDSMQGRDGEDQMWGDGGNDDMNGGCDNDYMNGGSENDRMDGDRGDDMMYGESGDDILDGRDGNDHLEGGDNDDELKGGKGDDYLDGGADDDRLDGHRGTDTCVNGESLRACEL